LPVEADSGESRCSRRRMGGSEVFVGASYRHDSARKSRSCESDAWICDLGLFRAIPSKNRAPKSTLVSREFFHFQILERVVSPSETELREIPGMSRRTGCLTFFSSCCVAALQACETSRPGPPWIADPGLFRTISLTEIYYLFYSEK